MPLSDAEISNVCKQVAGFNPEAIAVCFLHSYVDPTHEQIMGKALRQAFPQGLYHAEPRNPAPIPRIRAHLDHGGELLWRAARLDLSQPAEQAARGTEIPRHAADHAIEWRRHLGRECEPRAGGIDGIGPGRRHQCVEFEIGRRLGSRRSSPSTWAGTAAKASVVRDGNPAVAEGYYVGGYASGHPVMPVIDVVEVGAGSG